MDTSIIQLDSTQFYNIVTRLDSFTALSSDSSTRPTTFNTVFSQVVSDDTTAFSFIMEYFVAPAIIVFISVWVTNYSTRNKEYNRIKKLHDFLNVWINNIILGLDEQIGILNLIKNTFVSIEFDGIRSYSYANIDTKSITDVPKADLYKLFISLKSGEQIEKSQKFYDLLFAINSSNALIEDYKNKSKDLNRISNNLSDEAFSAVKKLTRAEREYAGKNVSKAEENQNYKKTKKFNVSREYSIMANKRQKYLAENITRTKRAFYYYSKLLSKYCAEELSHDEDLQLLLELNMEVTEKFTQLTDYYYKIRNSFDAQIEDIERLKKIIIENQTYFNELTNVGKLRFKD